MNARGAGGGPDPGDPIRQEARALGQVPAPVIIDDEQRGGVRSVFSLGRRIPRIVLVARIIGVPPDIPLPAKQGINQRLQPAFIRPPQRPIQHRRRLHRRDPAGRKAGIAEVGDGLRIGAEGQGRKRDEGAAPQDGGDLAADPGHQNDRHPFRRGLSRELGFDPRGLPPAAGQPPGERKNDHPQPDPPPRMGVGL